MADPIREDRAVRHRQFFDHGQRGVGFEPGGDAALRAIELGPPGIVVIAQIKDVGGAGLDRHRLGGGDVVDPRRGDRGPDQPIRVGIVDDMQFGAAHALGKPPPIVAAGGQLELGCIDQIGGLGQAAAQSAMRLRDISASSSLNSALDRSWLASARVERRGSCAPRWYSRAAWLSIPPTISRRLAAPAS
jgi:hypothetical protein